MKNKKLVWIAFVVLLLLQIYTPASVIFNREDVLANGTAFKFRTAPRDPNDYLRGKYISLNFAENSFPVNPAQQWKNGDEVFVTITKDSAGFAKIASVTKNKGDAAAGYIKTNISYISYGITPVATIEWPFERFYMEESKAPLAEEAYNKAAADSNFISYALVKVKKGDAVLENVYINDKPISAYIKK